MKRLLIALLSIILTHIHKSLDRQRTTSQIAAFCPVGEDVQLDESRYEDLEIALHRYPVEPMSVWTWWRGGGAGTETTWEDYLVMVVRAAHYAQAEGVVFEDVLRVTTEVQTAPERK